MDRRDTAPKNTGYNEELEREAKENIDLSKEYVNKNGALFRMPYRMIKRVTFSNIKKEEFIDQPHAARLQYRLMLLDPVIKAVINYARSTITVIYNPVGADNIREKISLDGLIEFLANEGIKVDRQSIKEEDYDYYNEFYNYAFNPKRIREHPPYGMSEEEWKKNKGKMEEENRKETAKKRQKFLEFQKKYKEEHSDILADME